MSGPVVSITGSKQVHVFNWFYKGEESYHTDPVTEKIGGGCPRTGRR